jgi:hypothetical protein
MAGNDKKKFFRLDNLSEIIGQKKSQTAQIF